jgi:hypothetical protein
MGNVQKHNNCIFYSLEILLRRSHKISLRYVAIVLRGKKEATVTRASHLKMETDPRAGVFMQKDTKESNILQYEILLKETNSAIDYV